MFVFGHLQDYEESTAFCYRQQSILERQDYSFYWSYFWVKFLEVPMLEHLIPDLLLYPVNIPHRTIYSDTSQVECAPYIYTEGSLVAHNNFDDLEMKQSL